MTQPMSPEESPYYRPKLRATREGTVRPEIEVEQWRDELQRLMAGDGPGEDEPQAVYELVALAARLRRVRPTLRNETPLIAKAEIHVGAGGGERLAEIAGSVQNLAAAKLSRKPAGERLAEIALSVPNPAAWMSEAAELERAVEFDADAPGLSERAEALLADLDDADLVCAMAAGLGHADRELAEELARCNAWLRNHAEVFMPAGMYIQAVGMAMRPDLAQVYPSLAITAEKYITLLEMLMDFQCEEQMDGIEPMKPDEFRASLAALRQNAPRPWWLAPATPRIAARTTTDEQTNQPTKPMSLRWREPGGALAAVLHLPAHPNPSQPLILTFLQHDGNLAVELAGKALTLGHLQGQIDSKGQTKFSYDEIASLDEAPLLICGGTRWISAPIPGE